MDFRGWQNELSYNFMLKYTSESGQILIVTWEQLENPFSIVDQHATVTNLVVKSDDECYPEVTYPDVFGGLSLSSTIYT